MRDETEWDAYVRLLLTAIGVLLTGCVDAYGQFYSEVPRYKGQNIDALVDRIGYADSQTFIAGQVVYTWTTASTMERDLRPMQAPPSGAPDRPILATISAPETVSLRFKCTLKVDTDGTGTILDLSWEGKPGGCAP